MSTLKTIVIEDEFFAANHLRDLMENLGHTVAAIYHSGEDFLSQTDWQFDLAVVDIFLSKKLTGLDVAEQLQGHQKPFIFLTANQDSRTLQDAARLKPAAYITKPFKTTDVQAALQIVAHQLPNAIKIRGSQGIELLAPHDILFIKSDGVYIEIHTVKGLVVQRQLLKEIEAELPDSFVRVHRSYLVNRHYVERRTATAVFMREYEVPVSRSYRDNL